MKLKDYVEIKRGSSPRPIIEFLSETGYKWLKISDFKLGDKYVYNTKEYIKEEGLKGTRLVKKGTLILTNSATPAIPIFLGKDMCLHDGFLYFHNRTPNELDLEYLYCWFINNRNSILSQANGSVFKNLKKEIVENLEINLPSIEIQKKIAKAYNTINDKIILNNQTNDNLLEIIKSIYNKWFVEYEYPNASGKFKESELGKIPQEWDIRKLEDVFFFQEGPRNKKLAVCRR